jgi:hypothetical protein
MKVKDLVIGQYYFSRFSENDTYSIQIFRFNGVKRYHGDPMPHALQDELGMIYVNKWKKTWKPSLCEPYLGYMRLASSKEIAWLNQCAEAGEYIPLEDVHGSFNDYPIY